MNWDLIFFLLTTQKNPKFDLGEIEKAMFKGVACHFELIIGLLTIPKCYLDEFENAMLQDL